MASQFARLDSEDRVISTRVVWEHDPIARPDFAMTADEHYGDGWSHVSEEDKAKTIAEYGSIRAACEAYAKQDADRYKAWCNSEWFYMGVYAQAKVCIGGVVQTIRSGGVYGIEDDSDEAYKQEMEQEELSELRDILARMGFTEAANAGG